jgi:hypothetical protein
MDFLRPRLPSESRLTNAGLPVEALVVLGTVERDDDDRLRDWPSVSSPDVVDEVLDDIWYQR